LAGLYIHIPFCKQFCSYCDFYSVQSQKWMPELLQALKDEMTIRRKYVASPHTLYIGGGTPSLYKAEEIGGLIEHAKNLWNSNFIEMTLEANPEDISQIYCQKLADYGVNRLSIGIQSFYDEHLRFMNRRHNATQGSKAVEAARNAGFKNISIDIIFGFPGLSQKQWRQTIINALSIAPEHISAYQLGLEPGTLLFKKYQQGLLQPVAQEEAAAQYALLQEMLSANGWEQYEISNFSRQGYRSLHNSAYWQGISYLGLGPSAHSYNGVVRHANVRSIKKYTEGVKNLPLAMKEERITHKKRYNEFIMTRLRTKEGFLQKTIEQQVSHPTILNHFKRTSEHLLHQGLLFEQEQYIKIPPHKWFVSDGIILELMV